jgi:signal transduction histidine kinase
MTARATRAAYGLVGVLTVIGFVGLWQRRDPVDVRLILTFLVVGLGLALAGIAILAERPGTATGSSRVSPTTTLVSGLLLLLGAAAATVGVPGPRYVGLTGLIVVLPVALLTYPNRTLHPWLARAEGALLAALGGAALVVLDHHNALASILAVQAIALACDLWWRTEQSAGDSRRSLLWLVYGLGFTAIVGGHVVFLVDGGKGRTIDAVALATALLITLAVPVTMTIGATNPRLRDIRQLIGQTVLYIVMLELGLALFIGATATATWAGQKPSDQVLGLFAVGLAAVFHPATAQVRRILDELLFGGTADPVATMTAFGAHLRSETDPRSWAQGLRAALALPRVEIWRAGELVGSSGQPVELTHTTPLVAGEEHIGRLVVGLPGDTTVLSGPTQGVINLVAAPLARALQAVQLAEQLRESREHVVVALEEERRRLRRDLHDGLGPVLAGVGYTADAARNVVRTNPSQAEELLTALRADAASAIADIRRIVVGLRPPALDELGLVGAVRQQTARLSGAGGQTLDVQVVEDETLPNLPAAIEVAAYRIAVEAVTNTARHSPADAVVADFALAEGALVVTVTDNATANGSIGQGWRPGVGLSSMRERCEQVGGSLEAGPTAAGGRVRATLPL